MRPRLALLLLLIVLLPVGLLGWLGVKLARDEQALVRGRFEELLAGRLKDVDAAVASFLEKRQRELEQATMLTNYDADEFRRLVQHNGIIDAAFMLDGEGKLLYPPADKDASETERQFMGQTASLWNSKDLLYRPPDIQAAQSRLNSKAQAPSQVQVQQIEVAPAAGTTGWYTWFKENGMSLLFWRRDAMGRTIGVELNRQRLLSDIIGQLPQTELPGRNAQPTPDGRIVLTDSREVALYQWGRYEPRKSEMPRVKLPMTFPLNSWRLDYFSPESGLEGGNRSLLFNLLSGLGVVVLALGGMAFYFYRESSRELRQAAQRVTFVNQVSHELKTPLTNIRMYAELLQENAGEAQEKARSYLDVIVSESRRLSRMIGNVLTFSRQQKHGLSLRFTRGIPDDVIRAVLENFRPAFESHGIVAEFVAGAEAEVGFDRDALEQILGNLFSNVEKYAANGKRVRVTSSIRDGRIVVAVADSGAGIPAAQREKIFGPFYRISNKLTDGITGTGIGLTIARELARLHGGDLRLMPGDIGATFEVTLKVQDGGPS